jgi:hypothetical protein
MEWGSGARETYPHPLPDLFASDRLVVVGRYETAGPCLAKLRGVRLGKPVELVYEGSLPERGGVPAVARLWAQRKVDFLLAEIARNGTNKELKDAIVSLATRHHIVTPFTAGLVVEDEAIRPQETVREERRIETESVDDHNEVDTGSEFEETAGEDGISDEPFSGPSTNSAIGLGGGAGGGRRGRGARRNFTEDSVDKSLRWLSSRQDERTGAMGSVTDTSLAVLTFLGAGYTDRGSVAENRYAKCVRAALRFLLEAQDTDGCFTDRRTPGWLRAHTAATLAMCEAFWMTRNPRYRAPAQKGLDFLASVRTLTGCWGDGTPRGEDDVLATAWAVLAMRGGKFAGLQMAPEAFAAARAMLETRGATMAPTEQAAALAARILLGEDPRNSDAITSLADALLAHLPAWKDGEAPPVDLWHFGTLGMFQVGGTRWRQWNDAMAYAIVRHQRQEDAGDLAGTWPLGTAAPAIGDQAKLAMCLEVYYRYDRVFGVK